MREFNNSTSPMDEVLVVALRLCRHCNSPMTPCIRPSLSFTVRFAGYELHVHECEYHALHLSFVDSLSVDIEPSVTAACHPDVSVLRQVAS